MKRKSVKKTAIKKKISLFPVILGISLIIVISIFLLNLQKNKNLNYDSIPRQTRLKVQAKSEFQKLLQEECKPVQGFPHYYRIATAVIPLNIKSVSQTSELTCISSMSNQMSNGYILGSGFYIFDIFSKQTIPNGNPIDLKGIPIISTSNDVYLESYFNENVMVRGSRNLNFINTGEEITITLDQAIMSIEDPRIIRAKRNYSINNFINNNQASQYAVYEVFKNLQQIELDYIDTIISKLLAIQALSAPSK